MQVKLRLQTKGIILVLVPLVFELIFIVVLSWLLHNAEIEVQKQIRSRGIVSQANALSKLFYDAGVAMAGYNVTKSSMFSDRFANIGGQISDDLRDLKELIGDNTKEQQILHNLEEITATGLKLLNEAKLAIDTNSSDLERFQTRHMFKEIRQLADRLQEELQGLTDAEGKIAHQSPNSEKRFRTAVWAFLALMLVFNILLTLALADFFSLSISQRLKILTDNSFRLARGDPLNPLIKGDDEISALDRTFHNMASALSNATRKERAVIENARDVICSIDLDGKFIAVSAASLAMWGYAPEELIGRSFLEIILPEDQDKTLQSIKHLRAQEGNGSFENRTRSKDGAIVEVLWSSYWSEIEHSMFCVAHDITERKLAEEAIKASERKVRTMIENMPVGLMIVTKDGVIESINPATERSFNYHSDELYGQHVTKIFSDPQSATFSNSVNFMETLWQRSFNHMGEWHGLKKNGDIFAIEISLSEFETSEGPRILASILDVSERKEIERLKKEFVSTVSHELRTPLTSIRGSLTLLNVGALGNLPDEAKKAVGIAERNTVRLITLINDILEIEKLESGKLELVLDTVAMKSVFERTAEAVRSFAEQNDVRLQIMPTNASAYADSDRLVQVLVNLISNAVKFSPKGESVTVTGEENGDWIEMKVIDHGRGIPVAYKNLLFQRFQQVETSDSRKKGGTGLGLAICKGIIELHGGSIGVDSEEGKGSVFWFKIPRGSEHQPAKSNEARPTLTQEEKMVG